MAPPKGITGRQGRTLRRDGKWTPPQGQSDVVLSQRPPGRGAVALLGRDSDQPVKTPGDFILKPSSTSVMKK